MSNSGARMADEEASRIVGGSVGTDNGVSSGRKPPLGISRHMYAIESLHPVLPAACAAIAAGMLLCSIQQHVFKYMPQQLG